MARERAHPILYDQEKARSLINEHFVYEPRGVSLNDEKSLVPAYFLPCHPCLFAIVLCILRRMALPSLSLDGLRNGTVSIRLAATQCFLQYQNRTCSANTPVVRPKTT